MKEQILTSESSNFIRAWVLDDCSICDDIIEYFHRSEKTIGAVMTHDGNIRIDKKYKDSTDCFFDISTYPGKTYIQEHLKSVMDEYIKFFPMVNEYGRWGIVEPVNIKFYCPGAGYHAYHTERSSSAHPINNRHLVFMTYLNDVDDQGETEFVHQKIRIKPQKGLTVIWPADWTYTHRGIASMSQNKYIVTGWYSFF